MDARGHQAHIEFQQALNEELLESGELVDAQGLAGPSQAKFVVSDGVNAPVITDGPYPESKELLAGYRIDRRRDPRAGHRDRGAGVGRARRRTARRSASRIEVREVMSAPDPEV